MSEGSRIGRSARRVIDGPAAGPSGYGVSVGLSPHSLRTSRNNLGIDTCKLCVASIRSLRILVTVRLVRRSLGAWLYPVGNAVVDVS